MTRLHRLRYVQAFVDRKTGAVFRYFRRPGYPRVRLPGLPGSLEFMTAYQAALDIPQHEIGVTKRSKPGSVSAVIAGYYTWHEFRALGAGTQTARRLILERFRMADGDKPVGLLPQKWITHKLSTMKPHAAHTWVATIRALMQFAVAQEFCKQDPTQGIKLPSVKTKGYYTWNESDIAAFEAHYAIGSKPRLAFALLLYTAQRRSDVLSMGRQHIRDGVLTVRQNKTGTVLAIPVHSDLQRILDATPSAHLTFLTTDRGEPYGGPNFSNRFREWCDAAGLPKQCSAHGLRKAACRRLAEAGCSANEIAAISGHASLREVERYTKAVDQGRMARNAMARTCLPEMAKSQRKNQQ
jgi:integrase